MARDELRLTLTDEEWMSLIDGSEERGGLMTCCGNISDLRDAIMDIARAAWSDHGFTMQFKRERFKVVAGAAFDSHELDNIPALTKLLDQLGITKDELEHVRNALREM